MTRSIHFRIIMDPLGDEQSAFHCEIECSEADIQSADEHPHGFKDFLEKFFAPPMALMIDQFQQPYDDAKDLQKKMIAGGGILPRSIEFYRQNIEMRKALRAKN